MDLCTIKKLKHGGVSSLSIENRKYLVSRTNANDIFSKALKSDYEIKKVNSPKPIIHCKHILALRNSTARVGWFQQAKKISLTISHR